MPKHFLPLIGEKSLFQVTYDSLRKKFSAEDIYVSTNASQVEIAKLQEKEIPDSNFILEPEMRNHGPATGLVAAFLLKKGLGDEPFMLVQPDDLREPEEKFFEMMDACDELARNDNKYITGGIKPDYAIMGIDYLVKGDKVESKNGVNVYKVARFIWRGTKEMAEQLVSEGVALTHSNHTCMTPNNFLKMYQKYQSEWYEPLMNYVKGGDLATEYTKMPKGPIEDVTQKVHEAGESLVVELPFAWFDIGTWESVDKYLKQKALYEYIEEINLDSEGSFIKAPQGKTVALIGVKDLVVVDTGDALLICRKDQTGRVGEVVDKLKAENKVELL
jgi:mannose-1-phosphate guanylyltransferase